MTAASPRRRPHLLVLSADSSAQLDLATADLADRLDSSDADLETTAAYLRTLPELPHRRAVVAVDADRAAQSLRRTDARSVLTGHASTRRTTTVFLCAGVGDQYAGFGTGLARALPLYRRELLHCLNAMSDVVGIDLPKVLFTRQQLQPGGGTLAVLLAPQTRPTAEIHRTAVAQPLLFATQYAMAATLQSLGVEPGALAGYSIGEFVAACLAGVMPLGGALHLVAQRARLVADLPAGGMMAVMAGVDVIGDCGEDVAVAALNSREFTVLSGPVDALALVGSRLAERGVPHQQLNTSHAFHSPMMEPVVGPLRQLAADMELRHPVIPMLANGTGDWMGDEATDPAYWAGHLRNTVRFADNVERLWRLDDPVLVELGPGAALIRLAAQCPARPPGAGLTVAAAPGPHEKRAGLVVLMTALATLWTAGCPVRLDQFAESLADGLAETG